MSWEEQYRLWQENLNKPKSEARALAIAKRCQLLTGSFDGNDYACPCEQPNGCLLSAEEQHSLADNPEVLAAKDRNIKLFDSK